MEERFPEGEELEKLMARVYRLYQDNIRRADEQVYQLTRGARQGVPEKELLEIALSAMDKCRFSLDED